MARMNYNSKANKEIEKAIKDIKALKIKSVILYKATRRIYDRLYQQNKNVKKGRSKSSSRKTK